MRSVSEVITDIRSALDAQTNERALLELIDNGLCELRSGYRQSRSEFSEEAILFLKSLSAIQDALREFIEAIEEKNWVHTRDDAHEMATRFHEFNVRLSPHIVSKRAEKEMRELVAKSMMLPFAAIIEGNSDFSRRKNALEKIAKPCRKCGSRMVLRESQYGLFWGCSTFPKCFSRRWLSAEDTEHLFP